MHAVRNEAKLDCSRAHISKIYPLLYTLMPIETFKVMRDNFKIYNSFIVNVQNLNKN